MKSRLKFFIFLFALGLFYRATAQTVTEWRGPGRSGIYAETGLLKVWPANGPKLLWDTAGIGEGYSSVTVGKDALYITGYKNGKDVLSALSKSGGMLWQTVIGGDWTKSFEGSRCTPTLVDGKLYVSSGMGEVSCLDAANGKILWQVDVMKKYEGIFGEWGFCESPIVLGDKVFYSTAGFKTTMVALNKNTGEEIWKSETLHDTLAYVSPNLMKIGGKDIIVNVLAKYLVGVDASNGKIVWKTNYFFENSERSRAIWPSAPEINCNTPYISGQEIYVTNGYNHDGIMYKVTADGNNIEKVWNDSVLDVHHGGTVLMDGYIYGANWIDNGRGNWCCIDWKTGKKMWEEKWNCKGSTVAADGMLYIYDEKKGNVGLVKPNPQKFDLVSSFRITKGKGAFWAHIVIAEGVMYVRHGNYLMAYDIKAK
jgi:outer membrane protein assembly factor BamB